MFLIKSTFLIQLKALVYITLTLTCPVDCGIVKKGDLIIRYQNASPDLPFNGWMNYEVWWEFHRAQWEEDIKWIIQGVGILDTTLPLGYTVSFIKILISFKQSKKNSLKNQKKASEKGTGCVLWLWPMNAYMSFFNLWVEICSPMFPHGMEIPMNMDASLTQSKDWQQGSQLKQQAD